MMDHSDRRSGQLFGGRLFRGHVVLDRDGTINVDKHYLAEPGQVELLPGAAEGLRGLQSLGMALIVATNQSGVARGYFDESQLDRIHDRLRELLAAEGVSLDAIYYATDLPDSGSVRRKPAPGMLLEAARDFGFQPSEAFVVGDKDCDISLGQAVRATTVLVRTGYGAHFEQQPDCSPDHVVDNLLGVVDIVKAVRTQP